MRHIIGTMRHKHVKTCCLALTVILVSKRNLKQVVSTACNLHEIAIAGENEELAYCLKGWQALPDSVRTGRYPAKDDASRYTSFELHAEH